MSHPLGLAWSTLPKSFKPCHKQQVSRLCWMNLRCVSLPSQISREANKKTTLSNRWLCHIALIALTSLLAGCGPKQLMWSEEVQLQDGDILVIRRTALAQPFRQIGGTGGWENEGMTVEIASPVDADNPGIWTGKFVPLIFDRDPDTKEWFLVATFYSCTSWYDLGRPKLPYTEFRYRNHQWLQQSLSDKFIGREANMFTGMRSSGESDLTLISKQQRSADPRVAPEYRRVVSRWHTAC